MKSEERDTIIIAFNCSPLEEDDALEIIDGIKEKVFEFELVQVIMIPNDEFSRYIDANMKRLDFTTILHHGVKKEDIH